MATKVDKSKDDGDGGCDDALVDIHLLFNDITIESSKDVCSWILSRNFSKSPPELLNLVINSGGGELPSAFAIIDVMQTSAVPIRTVGLGEIQSAGLMIFMAGTKGERVLTPNTSIMSHQYSHGSIGKHNELVAIRKEFDLLYGRMMKHYKKHLNLSEADIKKYLLPSEDIYLSAKEALKLGICDRIAFK